MEGFPHSKVSSKDCWKKERGGACVVGYEASGDAETMKAQETGSLRPTQTNWGMDGGKGENVRPRRSNSPRSSAT